MKEITESATEMAPCCTIYKYNPYYIKIYYKYSTNIKILLQKSERL
jgi:hypothetical protein